jgi:1-acyl-sn-glycerol-3-phosphate acyltransferase
MTRSARAPEHFPMPPAVPKIVAVRTDVVVAPYRRGGLGRTFRLGYEYFVFYGLLVVFAASGLIWGLAAVILAPFLPRGVGQPLGQYLIMVGFRFFLWLMQSSKIISCDLAALDRLRNQGPLIIASNHPTLLDVMLIISRLPRVTCTAKAKLLNNPFVGASARFAGYIRNDRPTHLVRESIRQLHGGRQLLVFPEGTRTRSNDVGPFKGGFALIAKHAGVPIQTVFIESNSRFLGKGWSLLRKPKFPLVYRVRLGPAFSVEGDFRCWATTLYRFYQSELDNSTS